MLGGTLGALVTLAALVVLVACPATPSGGGGPGPDQPYLCANGTSVDGTTDTAGQTRCVSCNRGYTLENDACRLNRYVCLNGTPSSLDTTADGITRCVSCNAGYASFNEVCLPSYVCVNGVASDESADSVGQSRCVSCSPIATLNGTAGSIGSTCPADVMLGEGVRIGVAMQFGEGEDTPSGLAAIGETLYMIGQTTDALYTINIDSTDTTPDGRAMQVGSAAAGFDVGETSPTGLAAIGETLYMVGFINDVLYTLNIDPDDSIADGRAIRVGNTPAGFGVSEPSPYALGAIGDTLYMVGFSQILLYTLNTTTGGAALVSDTSVSQFGVGEFQPSGLAAIGDTLYMVGFSNRVLYTINIDSTDVIPDGRAMQVGSAAAGFGVSEIRPNGLVAIGGTLYMVGENNDALYALHYQ